MYRDNGRILEGPRDRHESNEAKVTIIVNDMGHRRDEAQCNRRRMQSGDFV